MRLAQRLLPFARGGHQALARRHRNFAAVPRAPSLHASASLPLRMRDRVRAGSTARMRLGNVIPYWGCDWPSRALPRWTREIRCFLRFFGRAWRESHLAEALGGFEAGAVGEF